MADNKNVIYGLCDPDNGELRYIGYSGNVKERYDQHHRPANLKSKTKKNNWLKSLLVQNKKAKLIIVEEYKTHKELVECEKEYIGYFKLCGAKLLNATEGGDGWTQGTKHKEESKQKMRKPKSEEARKNMKIAQSKKDHNKGGTLSLEVRKNMSIAQRNLPKEVRLRMAKMASIAHKGKILSEDHKKKISIGKKGMLFTSEHKQKLSLASKGKIKSESHRKNISIAQKNNPNSGQFQKGRICTSPSKGKKRIIDENGKRKYVNKEEIK